MNDSKDFQDAESVRSGNSLVTSQPILLPKHHLFEGFFEAFIRIAAPHRWAAKYLGYKRYIGNFANLQASFSAPIPQELNPPRRKTIEEPLHMSTVEKSGRPEHNQDLRCQSGPSAKDSAIFSGGDSWKNYGADQQRMQISDLHFSKFPTPVTFACLEDKVQDRGMFLFTIPEGSDTMDPKKWSWLIQWVNWDLRHLFVVFQCRILKYLMWGLLQHWTKSSRILGSERESVWRNKRPRSRTVSFEVDRLPTWSTAISGSLEPIILSKTTPTCSLLFFEIMIIRNSILRGREYSSMTKIPYDDILEGLYLLRIEESEKSKIVLELYDLETHHKKLGPDYHILKAMVKRSIEQEIRNKNFGDQKRKFWEERRGQESGNKTACTKNTRRLLAMGNQRAMRERRQLQFPPRMSISVENDTIKSVSEFFHAAERVKIIENPKAPEEQVPVVECRDGLARITLEELAITHFVKMAPSRMFVLQDQVCLSVWGEVLIRTPSGLMNSRRTGLNRMMTKVLRLCWKKGNGKKENPPQMLVTIERGYLWTEVIRSWDKIHLNVSFLMYDNWVAHFRTWSRRKYAETNPTCEIHEGNCTSYQNSRPKSPRSVTLIQVNEPHERGPNAPKFEDRSQGEKEWQEQGAREAVWKLAKRVFTLKQERAAFFPSPENRCLPASTLKPEEREFVVDSGASMHMISNKDLSNAEIDTLTKSCSLTSVITVNWEVQTHEQATVYVKELDIFLTMKVLDNTSAVLSLGKLFDENGYSYEWIKGQESDLTKNGIRLQSNTENFVPIVVSGLHSKDNVK